MNWFLLQNRIKNLFAEAGYCAFLPYHNFPRIFVKKIIKITFSNQKRTNSLFLYYLNFIFAVKVTTRPMYPLERVWSWPIQFSYIIFFVYSENRSLFFGFSCNLIAENFQPFISHNMVTCVRHKIAKSTHEKFARDRDIVCISTL